jgi:hypothetical protein
VIHIRGAGGGTAGYRRPACRGRRVLVAAIVATLAACEPADSPPRSAAAHGDSGVLRSRSVDSALAAFRSGLGATDSFAFAAPTRDSVVRLFLDALERSDTVALARLHLSRAEFAYLVYPGSRFARAPYRQPPDVTWMLVIERSNSALSRLLARRGGERLRDARYRCSDRPDQEGHSRYWGGCRVHYRRANGDTVTERLFSSVVERDGRFKIGSYANQF